MTISDNEIIRTFIYETNDGKSLKSKYHQFAMDDDTKYALAAGLLGAIISSTWVTDSPHNLKQLLESMDEFPVAVRKIIEALEQGKPRASISLI
ncbi:TPA: hypothetical protein ACVU43_003044 [Vibrio parahaemolyticus]